MELTAAQAKATLRSSANPEKAAFYPSFFKSGPGEYAEGDKFIGVTVPAQRAIAKKLRGMSLPEIEKLLISDWHEERLTAVFILVDTFERGDVNIKKQVYEFYLDHTKHVNNWDLVDASAHKIVGPFLDGKTNRQEVLTRLAKSGDLWERRISIISTFYYIKKGQFDDVLSVAEVLLHDKHDFIHKAVGWMLREMGKADKQTLVDFLNIYATEMPRTCLRYAIEKLTPEERQHYMYLKS